mmetsp:Transcript_46901/g.130283  ORF Transcript_46901/g.130283 Transcript_46901/m.130283 type:complete len:228 (+) Transcript_46901:147-830(+)
MGLGSGPATSFGKQADAQASSITEIISSRLFIGSAEAAHQVDLLRGLGIKNVVNCTEMRPFHPGEFAQHACPVSDSPREDISQYFDEAVKWVRSRYGAVLVYCVKGVSRSCTVLLAVLMHVSGIDLWTAWKLVKEKRPKVAPNPGFLEQLEAYERRIRGYSSVLVLDDGFHSREEAPALAAKAALEEAPPRSTGGKARAKEDASPPAKKKKKKGGKKRKGRPSSAPF